MTPYQFVGYMQVLLGFIMAEYVIIAAQFWYESRQVKAEGEAAAALGQLVAIFVLCAICGYGTRAIQPGLLTAMCIGSPMPPWLMLGFHALLALFSALFILSRRTRVIMRGLSPRATLDAHAPIDVRPVVDTRAAVSA